MGKFFKLLWNIITWSRIAVLNILFLLVVALIVVSISIAPSPGIPKETALFLAPTGQIVDQLTYNPSSVDLLVGGKQPNETRLKDLVEGIDRAAEDDRITAIVLKLNYLSGGGMSKLEEVGVALERFKQTGKRIYAYSDNFSQQQYYLASYADEVYLNELGTVLITGYAMYQNYFKEAASKLDVDFHVFRVGAYKDAVEPFIRNDMSESSREHNSRWINALWQRYAVTVENHRDLPAGSVQKYIEQWGSKPESPISNAQVALDAGLVDKVVSRVELLKIMQELFGEGETADTFSAFPFANYLEISTKPHKLVQNHDNTIGLVTASGTILDGEQPDGLIGGDSFSKILSEARKEKTLRALVVRVDSGGGSAFASEVMRKEIIKTKEQGIPVYISMGSVAASGGYWMAAGANQIWATPTTITGSIGVWALYPNINRSLQKLGVYTDGISTSKLAGAFHPGLPLNEEAKVGIQRGVDNIYQTFLSLVAEARDSDTEAVHLIAQGKVWTGIDAKDLGLVDRLGDLNDVIEAAASELNLVGYQIKEFGRPLSTKEMIIRSIINTGAAWFDHGSSAASLQMLSDKINKMFGNTAVQAMMQNEHSGLNVFASCLECIAL